MELDIVSCIFGIVVAGFIALIWMMIADYQEQRWIEQERIADLEFEVESIKESIHTHEGE